MRKNQLLGVQVIRQVLDGASLTAQLQVLWKANPHLEPGDRGAIQDLCFGVLRHLSELRAYVDAMTVRPIDDETLRTLLWVALYQLKYSRNAPHAVVNEAVAAGSQGKPWAKGLINALLRRFLRERESLQRQVCAQDTTHYSYPQWWVDRLRHDHPLHYQALLAEGNRRPSMTLRVNARQISRTTYAAQLSERGIAFQEVGDVGLILDRAVNVEALPGFELGLVSVQDYAAQLAAPMLDLRSGMRVCDACAAPGGKTAHILEMAGVELTALDASPTRLEKVRSNLQRLRLSAKLLAADAGQLDAWWDGRLFDRVLLDAPCSASGVVRRHPDSKWLRRATDIMQFAQQQRQLLDALWQVVAPGGKLLYVTCSVFKAENEDVIEAFLGRSPDARRIPGPPPLDADGRLMPDAHGDGFFYALLQKA